MSSLSSEITMTRSRWLLQFVGDYLGPAALLAFGIALWYYQAVENLFSFAAWGALDFLTGLALFRSVDPKDNRAAPLPLSYGIICAFVVLMIYKNGELYWTWVESACLLGIVVGLICWKLLNETLAVISFCTALAIASVPIIVSTYHSPQPWEWWMWTLVNTSAAIGMYLNYPWRLHNIASWLFVAVSTGVGGLILIFTIRPYF